VNESGGRVMEVNEGEEDKVSPVSCIKVVSVAADKGIVGAACSTLMRMPAVAAIFEKAMADKRVRLEDDDYEQHGRSQKQPRIQGPTTRSGATTGSSSRPPPPPQILVDTSPEPESESEEDVPVILRPGRPSERIQVPTNQEPEDRQTQQTERPASQPTSATRKKTAAGGGTLVPPMNWMCGQKQYSLQDALDDVVPKISFPQLLDVSPRLRRELAELLRSSVPRTRKKGKEKETQEQAVGMAKQSPLIMTEAHGDDEVNCLYIDAYVGNRLIRDVLVDGGAMLDLISQGVVQRLKLEKHEVKGLGMRLADDSLVRLEHYVWADVIVVGVVARIKAYVVPVSVTYKMLLSRRWLKRVKGIEHHETNVLYIEGIDKVRRRVKGKPASKEELEIVKMPHEKGGVQEVESDEAEDAIEILLHELDHWDEGGDMEEAEVSGNA